MSPEEYNIHQCSECAMYSVGGEAHSRKCARYNGRDLVPYLRTSGGLAAAPSGLTWTSPSPPTTTTTTTAWFTASSTYNHWRV